MAKVPDLGSDFAQRLLQDLRRRRERLGFQPSSSGKQQQRTSNTATPRDCSNSQKSLGSQKPHQATTHRSHQQGSNATVRAGDPRCRDAPTTIAGHAIVPFQGGGGSKQKPAASNVDLQMALALALSNSGKLQNIELVVHNGSIFFREPGRVQVHSHRNDYLLPPGAHVGGVAIGVQKLNDILMAYSSGAGAGRRSSVGAGKKLFRGSMDLEESFSMLMMLQEASDYMEGSGSGNVLLLKGKENRKSTTARSARIVEIVDEDSDAEKAKNGKITSNASMQIVAHNKYSRGHSPNSSSALQFSDVPSNSTINASKGEQDGSKVRVPNVIARLMGLENLPSAKAVAEHKGTEKFVKPEALPRKEIRANAMDRRLPIRIVASDRVLSKGLHENLLPISSYNHEESGRTTALSNSSSHHTTDSQVTQTMKELLWKMGSRERVGAKIQGDNERIIHEDRTLTEEINLKKSVSVGCRSDAGKKMDFLRRFRRNSSNNKPVIEEKHTTQEKSRPVEKKQATGIKQLLSRDSETKSRRRREKFIKENLATTETNAAGNNGKTAHMKRQAQTKHVGRQSMTKKTQNCREMQNETPYQNLEEKKPLNLDAAHRNPKLAYAVVSENHTEVYDFSDSKLSGIRDGDGGFPEKIVRAVEDSSTAGAGVVSPDQCEKQITEELNDPTIAAVERSEDTKALVQSTIAHINSGRTNHTASEITQTLETFTEEQQQQQMVVKEQLMDALGPTKIFSNLTDSQDHEMHVISCDSFTENQFLLMKMLLKDQYLLETAKTIVRVHAPVSFVNTIASNYSDKPDELLADVGREVIRRKRKRTEAMTQVSVACAANPKLRHLGDLIRELGGDIESLNISNKPHRQGDDGAAETLRMIFQRDIKNNHPDANSTWDFGWNRVSDLPFEKNEVVRDLEKNILGGIITDVARDLIAVSVTAIALVSVRPDQL